MKRRNFIKTFAAAALVMPDYLPQVLPRLLHGFEASLSNW
jgi:hypothetical protein